MGLHRTIDANLEAAPDRVFDALERLDDYGRWLDLVAAVEPATAQSDEDHAWLVTLRAKIGPFARAKRLRMVRTIADRPSRLRFERAEVDGRDHAGWIFDIAIAGLPDLATHVHVELNYEGGLWSTPIEAVLGSQVDNAVPKLQGLLG